MGVLAENLTIWAGSRPHISSASPSSGHDNGHLKVHLFPFSHGDENGWTRFCVFDWRVGTMCLCAAECGFCWCCCCCRFFRIWCRVLKSAMRPHSLKRAQAKNSDAIPPNRMNGLSELEEFVRTNRPSAHLGCVYRRSLHYNLSTIVFGLPNLTSIVWPCSYL